MSERAPGCREDAAARRVVTACVLVIGNEILSGRTQDANLAFIAKGLGEVGVRLREARVIPDDLQVVATTVNEVRGRFDYVFTTGGIGPTHDDITARSIADAFGVPLVLDPEAKRLLESHHWRGELNEARLRMAQIPEGARLLPNPISRAPGFAIGNVYVLPGVPSIMQGIFSALKEGLEGGERVLARSLACQLAEGEIAPGLAALQGRFSDLEIGSYPNFLRGGFSLTLVLRGTGRARLDAAVDELKALIRSLGGDPREEAAEG
jgi:molybdenum cofactor synthesis domain-containing protein